jgi:hypothetical protein
MIVFFSVRGWVYDAIQPEVTEEAHGWGICSIPIGGNLQDGPPQW